MARRLLLGSAATCMLLACGSWGGSAAQEQDKPSQADSKDKDASSIPAPPFTMTVSRDSSINGEAFGVLPIQKFAQTRVEEQRQGRERSQCRADYGQRSLSAAAADVRVQQQSPESLSLELEASSAARGGHYRTCGICAGQTCVGIRGNDTVGSATSRAAARVAIRFTEDLLYNDFEIRLDSSVTDGLSLRVTDGSGKAIERNDKGVYPINASPGSLVFVDAVLVADAERKGGAPQLVEHVVANIGLRVSKAPILTLVRGAEPYIVGGDPTSAYPEVVALLLRGAIHCSGTAVTARTVLTAAHCIHGYEADIRRGEMTVQGGTTITQPVWGPKTIVSWNYPDGKGGEIAFDPDKHKLTHDIGLVYVEDPLPPSPAALHLGQPSWTTVKSVPLYFVGFGHDRLGTTAYGAGVKREAAWAVANVDELRMYFQGSERSTCKADSGGPAFFIRGGTAPTKLLVGVTSAGNGECTEGFNTRVDAYRSWLTPRLKP